MPVDFWKSQGQYALMYLQSEAGLLPLQAVDCGMKKPCGIVLLALAVSLVKPSVSWPLQREVAQVAQVAWNLP